MRNDFVLNGRQVKAGSREIVNIRLPALHSDATVIMPVHVIHGLKEGPTLFISAAVHGDEINGVEIIRRVLDFSAINGLKGTLLAIPAVNVFGFDSHSRYLPDRRDLNRSFPGREQGTLAGRLANTFMTEIVDRSDIGIDLHSAAIHRDNLPQIRADLNDKQLSTVAKTFTTPVLLHSAPPEGSLRYAAARENVPVMVYEAGEALRFDETSIDVGVKGILGVLKELGMLHKSRSKKIESPVLLSSSSWVRATRSGILRAQVKLGDKVSKGDSLGLIGDLTGQVEEVVTASSDGVIIGRTNIPLIYEGDALFHIGRTKQGVIAEDRLDNTQSGNTLTAPEIFEEPNIV